LHRNLPIGAAAFLLVFFSLNLKKIPTTPERQLPLQAKLKTVDLIGVTLLFGFVSCLCITLQYGGNIDPWNSARVIGLLVGFGLLKVLFWLSQWKLGEGALIPVRFLMQRTVTFGSLFLFLDNMANYIASAMGHSEGQLRLTFILQKLYFLPFYFQAVLNTSAIRSGVNYTALAAPQFFGLLLSGIIVTRYGYYVSWPVCWMSPSTTQLELKHHAQMPVILIGQIICVVGTGLLMRIDMTTATAEWAVFFALSGFGLGMGINAPHIAIQAVMETYVLYEACLTPHIADTHQRYGYISRQR
jgi:hypothetical protein